MGFGELYISGCRGKEHRSQITAKGASAIPDLHATWTVIKSTSYSGCEVSKVHSNLDTNLVEQGGCPHGSILADTTEINSS